MNADAGHDERVEGSIPRQIEPAAALVAAWQPKHTGVVASGRFVDIPVVPPDAWLEAIVNAVAHRSYNLAGDRIRVEIFPNRIEIASYGRFPGLAEPARPTEIDRYARNPRIARACTDRCITGEFGEGIRRLFEEMRVQDLTDPTSTHGQASVRLALLGLSRDPDERSRPPSARRGRHAAGDPRRWHEPRNRGGARVHGLTRPTVIRHLNALRGEHLVVWSGKSAKDPRATWASTESWWGSAPRGGADRPLRSPRWPVADASRSATARQTTDLHLVNLHALLRVVLVTLYRGIPEMLEPADRRHVVVLPEPVTARLATRITGTVPPMGMVFPCDEG